MKCAVVVFMAPCHVPAFHVFIKTLMRHNPWFGFPIIVLETGMNEYWKSEVKKIYNNVEFRKPKYENYEKFYKNVGVIRINYYKLDAYSYDEFDKIVMLDLDMIVEGDIKELFYNNIDIGMVMRYDSTNDRLIEHPNGGVIVIGKKYLNQKTYKEILQHSSQGFMFTEQDAQDTFFKNKTYIDKIYNCEKRMINTKHQEIRNIYNNRRILHFIGPKPWEHDDDKSFNVANNYWHSLNEYKPDNKRVIVIGTAPSVLNNIGKVIDNFDIVIRVNNFKLKGYEDRVGTKTDYIVMGYCIPYCEDLFKYDPGIMHVFTGEHFNNIKYVRERMMQDHEKDQFKGCKLPIDEMNILDEYYFYGLNMKLGLIGKQRSTTGTVAIEWAINNFPLSEIFYTGIEFFEGGNKQQHYFDYTTNKNSFHDHPLEKAYVGRLAAKGYVKKW
jgi:lipopolysaccharide biosynthesis glycosyltransferase